MQQYDILIIGGGINGVGIALEAQRRGLKVFLCEKNQLASGTSSKSSQLVHGGLRYLANLDFKLVYESLKERAILQNTAPNLVTPLKFVIPFDNYPKYYKYKLSLKIYDLFANLNKLNTLPSSNKFANLSDLNLKSNFTLGLEYYDCQTDDAKLVKYIAKLAEQQGAKININTEFMGAEILDSKTWQVNLHQNNQNVFIQTKAIINASGPFIDQVNKLMPIKSNYKLKLSKGSHIVTNKIYQSNIACLLPTNDNRVIFTIPYQDKYTLIGTTDVEYNGNPSDCEISDAEINYLLNIINNYFTVNLSKHNIIKTWSGVRPLVFEKNKTLSKISREYKLELLGQNNQPKLINIFGGKLTTYRSLSEKVVNLLRI